MPFSQRHYSNIYYDIFLCYETMTRTIINKIHFRHNSLLAIKHILYYDLPNKTPVTAEITDNILYRHLELCNTLCDELQLPCSVFTYFPWLQHVKSWASLIISHSCCFCQDYLHVSRTHHSRCFSPQSSGTAVCFLMAELWSLLSNLYSFYLFIHSILNWGFRRQFGSSHQ